MNEWTLHCVCNRSISCEGLLQRLSYLSFHHSVTLTFMTHFFSLHCISNDCQHLVLFARTHPTSPTRLACVPSPRCVQLHPALWEDCAFSLGKEHGGGASSPKAEDTLAERWSGCWSSIAVQLYKTGSVAPTCQATPAVPLAFELFHLTGLKYFCTTHTPHQTL